MSATLGRRVWCRWEQISFDSSLAVMLLYRVTIMDLGMSCLRRFYLVEYEFLSSQMCSWPCYEFGIVSGAFFVWSFVDLDSFYDILVKILWFKYMYFSASHLFGWPAHGLSESLRICCKYMGGDATMMVWLQCLYWIFDNISYCKDCDHEE